jgi:anti-sigma factor RsiW
MEGMREDGMECRECREILSARMDGEATKEEAERAVGHVEQCAACRHYQAGILSLRETLSDWTDEAPLPVASRFPGRATPARRWLGLTALVLLAAGSGFVVGRSSAPRPSVTRERRSGFTQRSITVFPETKEVYSVAVLEDADPSAARLK